MTLLRRFKLVAVYLLAAALLGGSVLPPPAAIWQCRHALRIVDAGWAAPRSAMPCATGATPMPHMACCPLETAASPAFLLHHPALSRSFCRPTLTCTAALPLAAVPEAQTCLRQSFTALDTMLPLPPALILPVPAILSLRQRPPPTLGFAQSAPQHSFGLRAPPAA